MKATSAAAISMTPLELSLRRKLSTGEGNRMMGFFEGSSRVDFGKVLVSQLNNSKRALFDLNQ